MRWQIIPGDPANDDKVDEFGYMDRVTVTDMAGDLGMTYLSDVAVWFADQNIRAGYDVRAVGGCFKGPYAIKWRKIEIALEPEVPVDLLRTHLASIWGPEGQHLAEGDDPRLARIE